MSRPFLASLVGFVLSLVAMAWRAFVVPHLRSAAASRALGDCGAYLAVALRRAAARIAPGITLRTAPAAVIAAVAAEGLDEVKRLYPRIVQDLETFHGGPQAALLLEAELERQIAALDAAPLPEPPAAAPVAPAAPPAPPAVSSNAVPTPIAPTPVPAAARSLRIAAAPHGRRAGFPPPVMDDVYAPRRVSSVASHCPASRAW